tara:strand:+ start:190 stop:396 length:207 start_codon:yes stop_codon:yes gene_type:complete
MGCNQSLTLTEIDSISKYKLDSFYLEKPERKKNRTLYISDIAIMISDLKKKDREQVAYKIIELNQMNQ